MQQVHEQWLDLEAVLGNSYTNRALPPSVVNYCRQELVKFTISNKVSVFWYSSSVSWLTGAKGGQAWPWSIAQYSYAHHLTNDTGGQSPGVPGA